jgi:hypothetical protein
MGNLGELVDNVSMPALIFAIVTCQMTWAAPNYVAERDPVSPEAGKQYRLWIRTPARACATWRKVKPILPNEDMVITESKRDETGKAAGCKFLWVINSPAAPGDLKFELEGITGAKENFEVPMSGGSMSSSTTIRIGGIANENGTGMATGPVKGSLRIPGGGVNPQAPTSGSKSADPGTGL